MLRTALTALAVTAAAALAPSGAQAATTLPGPTPTPTADWSYTTYVDEAYGWDTTTSVTATVRVMKRSSFSIRAVPAAGQTVLVELNAATTTGHSWEVDSCTGVTDAYGIVRCTLSRASLIGRTDLNRVWVAADRLSGGYVTDDWGFRDLEIRSHE